jgi:hypothetical protein
VLYTFVDGNMRFQHPRLHVEQEQRVDSLWFCVCVCVCVCFQRLILNFTTIKHWIWRFYPLSRARMNKLTIDQVDLKGKRVLMRSTSLIYILFLFFSFFLSI